ncbi:MAG: hypothetical protein H0T46_27490 [Deltaproteobacteria bacterium]|nr:hypothetical protein [Deltaproteobacteria bacterium]
MSYDVWTYLFPRDAFSSSEQLAQAILVAQRGVVDFVLDAPVFALIAEPNAESAAWCLSFGTTSEGEEIRRVALRYTLRDRAAIGTVTEVYHNDRSGLYWFNHQSTDVSFVLASVGPYLVGDRDKITCPYPQRRYTDSELRALHDKPEDERTTEEFEAIEDYKNAVQIGLEMFYPGRVDYLQVFHQRSGWVVSDGETNIERAMTIELPHGWHRCVEAELPDDLAALAGAVADDDL